VPEQFSSSEYSEPILYINDSGRYCARTPKGQNAFRKVEAELLKFSNQEIYTALMVIKTASHGGVVTEEEHTAFKLFKAEIADRGINAKTGVQSMSDCRANRRHLTDTINLHITNCPFDIEYDFTNDGAMSEEDQLIARESGVFSESERRAPLLEGRVEKVVTHVR